ncbi:EAL domain-containing protein [Pseudoduganella danionis]|uniref:EAL domain-containing protein n=1 Tax=Pseudoduganella danionis TaxID=1890295 RepID=UPI0035B181AD
MSYSVLQDYLARLSGAASSTSSIWLDHAGRAQGRFFNCTLSSAFHPIRALQGGAVQAYEGLARSAAAQDQGLSLWRLLDHAASDDESVELDRLCRLLHALNFFRQAADGGPDLYLNVHDRLLSAVSSNHGHAFRRILDALELPLARVVLQLPAATPQQGWLLNYVADNYRRNGFRLANNVTAPAEALQILERLQPAAFKLDASVAAEQDELLTLFARCHAAGVGLVFKRIETAATLERLRALAADAGVALLGQGYLLDQPSAQLAPLTVVGAVAA